MPQGDGIIRIDVPRKNFRGGELLCAVDGKSRNWASYFRDFVWKAIAFYLLVWSWCLDPIFDFQRLYERCLIRAINVDSTSKFSFNVPWSSPPSPFHIFRPIDWCALTLIGWRLPRTFLLIGWIRRHAHSTWGFAFLFFLFLFRPTPFSFASFFL